MTLSRAGGESSATRGRASDPLHRFVQTRDRQVTQGIGADEITYLG
jgi:hypothetical protein